MRQKRVMSGWSHTVKLGKIRPNAGYAVVRLERAESNGLIGVISWRPNQTSATLGLYF